MRLVIAQADNIMDHQEGLHRNVYKLKADASPMDQELDAVAKSAVKSARDLHAKMIVVITMSGKVARAVAAQRPTVPVLAFCTDPQIARRLQLHRGIAPIMLHSALDPGSPKTRMGLLRAEAIRTAKEMGFLRAGDRIVTVDRTAGKDHDMHDYAHNLKLVTIRDT
jgi:pyruvate kinase